MIQNCCKRVAIFPGTFDPFTRGHYSVVDRALSMFDEVVIAIGINALKHPMYTVEERIAMLEGLYADEPRVSIVSYSGLTVDVARECGAQFMLRGVRTVIDFEYERSIADVNREISGLETVMLFTEPMYAHISSSVVRELLSYGRDVSAFVPQQMKLPVR
ncbi:MAG: pantetheine-phosphate adenylyltransferase [Bacteroidaceae bacterium]|nr:pantetheine-phosphate adenylyltransferase [Bacteroidaceae bacterium]MBR3950437.1 pantetheine-phosphate adenylyltransferase [Bacteroidaceae bacterium]